MKQLLIFLLLAISGSFSEKSTHFFDSLRMACPYNDFCTVSSLRVFNSTGDTQPCCMDCFCDEYSVAYGDSCPDFYHENGNSAIEKSTDRTLECKPLYFKDGSKSELALHKSELQFFRFIDFCPSDFVGNEVLRAKCMGNYFNQVVYDDIVAVSSKNGALFKNRFCARCHGETDVIRWNLKVLKCMDRLDDLDMAATDMEKYILKNCVMTSSRPEAVPINSRTIDCRDYNMMCEERLADEDRKQACLNGTRMPVLHFNKFEVLTLFKNAFCANCDEHISEICPKIEGDYRKTFGGYSMSILLNIPSQEPTRPQATACKEFEKYDHQKGQCRRLFCPPFEVAHYGECISIAQQSSNFLLKVKIIYIPIDAVIILDKDGEDAMYNEALARQYIRSLEIEFRQPNCKIYKIGALSNFRKISKKFQFITVDIVYEITNTCLLLNIGQKMKSISIKNRFFIVRNKTIMMHGQITFFDALHDHLSNEFEKYGLFSTSLDGYSVKKFFLCPYFILDIDELKLGPQSKNVFKNMAITDTNDLAPIPYKDGVYPLSEQKIAVCVGMHQNHNFAERKTLDTWCLLIFFSTRFINEMCA